jgi:hypothetical protein
MLETVDHATVTTTVTGTDGRFALPVPDPTKSYVVVVETPRTQTSVPVPDITEVIAIEISTDPLAPPVQMPTLGVDPVRPAG